MEESLIHKTGEINMDLTNIEIFQEKFNRLEQIIRSRYFDGDMSTSLYSLLNSKKNKSRMFQEHLSHFKALKNLRNNIAHGDREEYYAIPTDKTIELLDKLLSKLENPPIIDTLQLTAPLIAKYEDTLSNIVSKMIENDYSQVPVLKGDKIIGLMTLESVFKGIWNEKIIMQESTLVESVVRLELLSHRYKKMNKQTNAADIIREFDNSERCGKPLILILVTELNTEEVIGIVTTHDIVNIYKKVRILE